MIDWAPPPELPADTPAANSSEYTYQMTEAERLKNVPQPYREALTRLEAGAEKASAFENITGGVSNIAKGVVVTRDRGDDELESLPFVEMMPPKAYAAIDATFNVAELVEAPTALIANGAVNGISAVVKDVKNESFSNTGDYLVGVGKNIAEAPFNIVGGGLKVVGGLVQGAGWLTQAIPGVGSTFDWIGTEGLVNAGQALSDIGRDAFTPSVASSVEAEKQPPTVQVASASEGDRQPLRPQMKRPTAPQKTL